MTTTADKLKTKRNEINAIDSEVLELLNRRAEIAMWIGAMKSETDASLCDETREREVLDRLCRDNVGPLDEQAVRVIFQRVIDESLYLQQKAYRKKAKLANKQLPQPGPVHVAVLGERGTFSEEAVVALLGDESEILFRPTLDEIFQTIERGDAELALVPLENSLAGAVHRCFDLLLDSRLQITAEVFLPVGQHLIAGHDATIGSIRTVESHPVALAQCDIFFGEHPQFVRLEANDTAGSVRRAVESGDPTRAAIGSRRAAEIFGGKILCENIEDHGANWTRFILLSREKDESDHGEKVSLVVRLKHQPGSLHSALRPFVRREINLLKIESRPVKGDASEFSFYLELEVPAVESEFTAALAELRRHAAEVRIIGRYSTLDLMKGARS
jgi:prephenate dehydratase/chorismate mutase